MQKQVTQQQKAAAPTASDAAADGLAAPNDVAV